MKYFKAKIKYSQKSYKDGEVGKFARDEKEAKGLINKKLPQGAKIIKIKQEPWVWTI